MGKINEVVEIGEVDKVEEEAVDRDVGGGGRSCGGCGYIVDKSVREMGWSI